MAREDRRAFDALFVINQNVSPAEVGAICKANGYHQALLVTSHRLFGSELSDLRAAAGACEIDVTTFGDWLTDGQMEACDDRATADLAPRMRSLWVRVHYARLFAARSLYFKNELLRDRLLERCSWRRMHYVSGLGVYGKFWRRLGEPIRSSREVPEPRRQPELLFKLRLFLAFVVRTTRLQRVEGDRSRYYFNSTRRLALRPGTSAREVVLRPWKKVFLAATRWTLNPSRIVRAVADDGVLATTIHAYPSLLADDQGAFQVFLDGFHPSNYPRSYIDAFGSSRFVAADPLSVEWFTRHGFSVLPAPTFIERPAMRPPAPDGTGSILLALNHAGDWTSLINRSDTDALVEAFCNAAARFPALQFIVRPHPTMANPAHEGPGSRDRLARRVESAGLANLHLSSGSLEQDIEGCDVAVSEYSQVLIDAFRAGKLGLVANFTGRRSFMIDYEKLGFASVHSEEALVAWLSMLQSQPESLLRRQSQAVEGYNAALERWMSRAMR